MEFISKFFSYITRIFYQFWSWIAEAIKELIGALFIMIGDVGIWAFDKIMGLVVSILTGIDIDFSTFNPATYIQDLDPQIIQVLGMIKLPEAIGIIVSAIIVKITLQLIPFTRLGS